MTSARQYMLITRARRRLFKWAKARHLPLTRVEFVVSFAKTDFSPWTWLFYDTDASVAMHAAAGDTAALQERFLTSLQELGYPARWLARVGFVVDSHENVVKNYEDSYFYWLR